MTQSASRMVQASRLPLLLPALSWYLESQVLAAERK